MNSSFNARCVKNPVASLSLLLSSQPCRFFIAFEAVDISALRSLWLIIFFLFFPKAMQWFSAIIAFMCISSIFLPLFWRESHCQQAGREGQSISSHRFQSLLGDPQMFLNQLLDIISRADAGTAWGLHPVGAFL